MSWQIMLSGHGLGDGSPEEKRAINAAFTAAVASLVGSGFAGTITGGYASGGTVSLAEALQHSGFDANLINADPVPPFNATIADVADEAAQDGDDDAAREASAHVSAAGDAPVQIPVANAAVAEQAKANVPDPAPGNTPAPKAPDAPDAGRPANVNANAPAPAKAPAKK